MFTTNVAHIKGGYFKVILPLGQSESIFYLSIPLFLLTECIMKGDKNEAVIPAAPATAIPRARTTVGNTSNVI